MRWQPNPVHPREVFRGRGASEVRPATADKHDPGAFADYLLTYLARLEAEAASVRRRAEEIDEQMEVVRGCLAVLPERDPRDGADPPVHAAEADAGMPRGRDPEALLGAPAALARPADPAAEPLPPLTVRLLGEFRLFRGDAEVRAQPGSKVLRLLKFLLLRAGAPVAREVLADTFWRRSRPAAGAQSVYSAVHAARHLLAGGSGLNYLGCAGGLYEIAPGAAIHSDVAAFEQALGAAALARARGDAQASAAALERACLAYTGELLPEERYERWAADQRVHLAARHADALFRLARHAVDAGDLERAIECHGRVLGHDPLREETHRELVELYGRTGRRDLAVQQFERLRRLLRDELGVEPDPRTRATLEAALRA